MNISKVISWFFLLILAAGCGIEGNQHSEDKLFTFLPAEKTGIDFVNVLEDASYRHYINFNPVYNGGGVAAGDVNNDGLPDLYFTGNEVPNKLYLNKGDFQFEDISQSAGVDGVKGWHNGVNMVDINSDGLLDIYVCKGGWVKDPQKRKNLLYINKGGTTFEESAATYGLADSTLR